MNLSDTELKKLIMRTALLGIYLLICSSSIFAQAEGGMVVTVYDEKFLPIPGANVYATDHSFGGATDLDGRVTLPSNNLLLEYEISFLGYETLTRSFIDIRKQGAKIHLKPVDQVLMEVLVVGRTDAQKEEIPYQIEKITSKEIAHLNPQTSADALASTGQVYVQKSQMGGGSPVMRGFEANKVLLVVDGVRMNNAIYRSGHLQNSITVDNSALDGMEVIFGPGSLMYGSDALGGVIHFRTRKPSLLEKADVADQKLKAAGFVRFASANLEKTAHLDFDYSRSKMGMYTSLSYSNYGDLRVGNVRSEEYPDFGTRPYFVERQNNGDVVLKNSDPNVMAGSGYWQMDLLHKIRIKPNDHWDWGFNFQLSNSSNVPRTDKINEDEGDPQRLIYSEWNYGPQLRGLGSVYAKWVGNTTLLNKAKFITAYQRINEDRLTRRFANAQRVFQLEDVHILSTTLDMEKWLNEASTFKFLYGAESNKNFVNSNAGRIDITTDQVTKNELTRYPSGGSTMYQSGLYGLLQYKTDNSAITFNAGARYSTVNISSSYREDDPFEWPSDFYDGIEVDNQALTWGGGMTVQTPTGFQLRGLVSSAFRAPNLDDFSKIREKNGFVTVPNPDLIPEKSLQYEFTVGQFFGKQAYDDSNKSTWALNVSASGFYNQLKDAIIVDLHPTPSGDSVIRYDDEIFETMASQNAESGYVKGLSTQLELLMGSKWSLDANWNVTFGRSFLDGEAKPMSHIPPPYGKIKLGYVGKKMELTGVLRYNGFKPISEFGPGTADNADLAYAEGSFAWQTYNLYSTFHLGKKYAIQFALENIADLHYRPFASGISAPGRNFIVTLRKKFD